MEAVEMTREQLVQAAKAGTLTEEQEVEFYVKVWKMPRLAAREIVYSDWDEVERNMRTGEGPIP